MRFVSLAALAASLFFGTVSTTAQPYDYNKLYTFKQMPLLGGVGGPDTAWYFAADTVAGKYPRTTVPMREGGTSDLFRDVSITTPHTFWTINDRGVNVAYEPAGKSVFKVFPYPGYHHKLLKVQVIGDSIQVISRDSIKGIDSGYTVGLPSTKAPSGEIALRMRFDSAKVDSSIGNRVAPSINGYDFEGIVKSGNNFYLSDEYGPFIVRVDATTMKITKEWYPAQGLPNVLARRRSNRGMESLALTPSGNLVGMIQSGMYNTKTGSKSAAKDSTRVLRVVWFNPGTEQVKEFVYLSDKKNGTRNLGEVKIGAMAPMNDSTFLVIEHGVDKSGKYWMDAFKFTITAMSTNVTLATDPDSLGTLYVGGTKTLEQLGYIPNDSANLVGAGVIPVKKELVFLDIMAKTAWPHLKPEGISFINDSTLALSNDNDYGMVDKGADGVPHQLPAATAASQMMYINLKNPNATPVVRPQHATLPAFTVTTNPNGWLVKGFGAFEALLTDAQGRKISSAISTQGEIFLPRTTHNGIYWLNLRADGVRESHRIVQW